MAETRDRVQPHQLQVHSQTGPRYEKGVFHPHKGKSQGPSAAQILAIVTLLPVGGSLLGLAGIILVGTLIALAVATPLFVIFSPILVPAVILMAGAVTGILTSGAFGLTGLSSLSWVVSMFRQATGGLDNAKRKLQETAREAGEAIGDKAKNLGEPEEQQRSFWG